MKRHNRVYIFSSKHTYRPMRVCVVAQLLYKYLYKGVPSPGIHGKLQSQASCKQNVNKRKDTVDKHKNNTLR